MQKYDCMPTRVTGASVHFYIHRIDIAVQGKRSNQQKVVEGLVEMLAMLTYSKLHGKMTRYGGYTGIYIYIYIPIDIHVRVTLHKIFFSCFHRLLYQILLTEKHSPYLPPLRLQIVPLLDLFALQ